MTKRRRNPDGAPMSRCERGVWIDSEGSIGIKRLEVAQTEKEVLEEYCESARADGIPCRVRYVPQLNQYRTIITGYENIAREIALTNNCIRTKKKHRQIKRFKQKLEEPRKRLKKGVIAARQILFL